MYLIWELLIVASVLHTGGCRLLNNYDQHVEFKCDRQNQFVSHVSSIHSNPHEDRVFSMKCRDFPVKVAGLTPTCYWTGYINDWDQVMIYQCPGNSYIGGFQSDYSNPHKDRRWKAKCCHMKGIYLAGCHYTPWTNNYDGKQNFDAETNRVTKGIASVHLNGIEDRIYKFTTCEVLRKKGKFAVVGKE
ncbi:hemagglutinin/amebocyte aggregation factor-like [Ruditapes philippinarum]|uniref:hemagglutinin/amebocyte aggregation factor-like n=1 Tax=Ruditapes philippinarum TaxID=129788 RepID=UPI00295B4FA5|nr:hemagglutinin/amebocyte aggregation factor-like [Ruditapes philippinarum]